MPAMPPAPTCPSSALYSVGGLGGSAGGCGGGGDGGGGDGALYMTSDTSPADFITIVCPVHEPKVASSALLTTFFALLMTPGIAELMEWSTLTVPCNSRPSCNCRRTADRVTTMLSGDMLGMLAARPATYASLSKERTSPAA